MIKDGVLYVFKSWNKMKEQYGMDYNGNIKCICGFVPEMKYLCGKKYMRKKRRDLYYDKDMWAGIPYNISSDMVELLNLNKRIGD